MIVLKVENYVILRRISLHSFARSLSQTRGLAVEHEVSQDRPGSVKPRIRTVCAGICLSERLGLLHQRRRPFHQILHLKDPRKVHLSTKAVSFLFRSSTSQQSPFRRIAESFPQKRKRMRGPSSASSIQYNTS